MHPGREHHKGGREATSTSDPAGNPGGSARAPCLWGWNVRRATQGSLEEPLDCRNHMALHLSLGCTHPEVTSTAQNTQCGGRPRGGGRRPLRVVRCLRRPLRAVQVHLHGLCARAREDLLDRNCHHVAKRHQCKCGHTELLRLRAKRLRRGPHQRPSAEAAGKAWRQGSGPAVGGGRAGWAGGGRAMRRGPAFQGPRAAAAVPPI